MSDSWRPSATLAVLRRRAELVERTRGFFRARAVLEVDTPVLQGGANLDHGVVAMRLDTDSGPRWLPTSPEHPLKRLVCAGAGAVWTLAPAFRVGEQGRRHAPEFRMLEWYRPGWDDRQLAAEVVALLADLTGFGAASETIAWRQAFIVHAGIDPCQATTEELIACLGADAAVAQVAGGFDRGVALDLILTREVEPQLGRGRWTILTDYPAEACAQARLRQDAEGHPVAARFELYRDGIELANGYWELSDATELERRLQAERARRPEPRPELDRRFLDAIAAGLPDCAGVAVGFDRVVMLALGLEEIPLTQAFPWHQA